LLLAKLIALTYIIFNTAGPSALVHGSAFLYLLPVHPYTKPFLPVADQIARIQARGMVITDHGKAQQYLENIGYYRLSGYWYPMRRSQTSTTPSGVINTTVLDIFRPGSEFSQVVDLYVFDKKLRLIMLDALERIEIALRTDIALQLGQYDPWAYRNPKLLDGKFTTDIPKGRSKTRFQDFIDRFDRSASESKEDFVKHFRATYSNPLPIWAAVELWDFGALSMFLSGMKYRDQRSIAARYGVPRPEVLPTWVRTLAFVRNVCAHH
jgi:abortive infection bacteriophage resistance protein